MDFNFSEAEERFRREVRSFLQQEIPPDWEGIEEAAERDESWAFAKRFNRKLGAKGWLSLAWPTAFGGQGRSQMENLVFKEEMTYFFYRSPAAVAELDIVAPALMAFGSEKQKRELLPLIARGEAFFALGYTEPETGSDLSSLRTRAAAAGDDFIINGQKTFISAAHRATHCWLAARTDLEAPKHRGISLFALEMPAPGITVRPLMNMAGFAHFNEVYFDNVRLSRETLVGELNRGWYHVAAALDFERSGIQRITAVLPLFDQLVEWLKGQNKPVSKVMRHRLAEIALEFQIGRVLSYRVVWMQSSGLVPNYEASIAKVFGSELSQRFANVAMQALGLYGALEEGSPGAVLMGRVQRAYRRNIATTIQAGTSEVQRNIVATRGLGLSRA
ncbi:MAG: acyl-CoA dehydrogenase family protein [Chloroflexota bacterium]|nr:acyl-CoA dehydrogenase family protein [Chloroflexota bacterium]